MSATGEFITPPIYTDISGLSATLFRVRLQNYYSEILINDKGQVLTKGFKKGN